MVQPWANLDALAMLVLMLMNLFFGLGMIYLVNQVGLSPCISPCISPCSSRASPSAPSLTTFSDLL